MDKSKLSDACYAGDVKKVKALLADKKNKLDGSDGGLCQVAGQGKGKPYSTPFGEAARAGHLPVIELLIKAGAPLESVNYQGMTAYLEAVHWGHLEIARRLLAAGARAEAIEFGKFDALACALTGPNRTTELVRFVLQAGCDPTKKRRGMDAFDRVRLDLTQKAALRAELEVLQVLREFWKGPTKKLDDALAKAGVAAGVAAAAGKKADDAQAKKYAALAAPGPKRKAAILKAIGKESAERHDELAALAKEVLSRPDVIADAAWPDWLRALTLLTPSWAELMKEQFGGEFSIDDEGDDESNTMEMIGELQLSTIELALGLLAAPAAIARTDWVALVTFVCDEKRARLGGWSYGDTEVAALFKPAGAKGKDKALRQTVKKSFPYAKI